MKYLAILKDSIREAIDSKVMYVLFALSTISVLVVATLSFKPLPAQTTIEQFFPSQKLGGLSIMFVALNHQEINNAGLDEGDLRSKKKGGDEIMEKLALLHEFRLEKVKLLTGEADAPESGYVVTLTETFPRLGANGDKDKHAKAGSPRVRQIFQKAEDMGFLTIQDIAGEFQPPADGNGASRFNYHVTLQGNSQTFRIWAHEPSLFFGAVPIEILSAPLAYQLHVLGQTVLSFGAWVAILVGVVITSFFIPSMLSKGTVDMLLVKPIQRWALLLYKYVGGLTFIFLNTAYAVVGLWLVIGLRTGVWANALILLVLTITFYFAILYAVSTFVSVMTRNIIAAIIVTIGAWFLFFLVGVAHKNFDLRARAEARQQKREPNDAAEGRWGNSRIAMAVRVLHTITPRTEELNQLNERITYYAFMTGSFTQMWKFDTGEASAWESLLVSFSWIGVFLGLGCVFFSFKNY